MGVTGEFCVYLRDKNGALIPINNRAGIGSDELILYSDDSDNIRCGDILT